MYQLPNVCRTIDTQTSGPSLLAQKITAIGGVSGAFGALLEMLTSQAHAGDSQHSSIVEGFNNVGEEEEDGLAGGPGSLLSGLLEDILPIPLTARQVLSRTGQVEVNHSAVS